MLKVSQRAASPDSNFYSRTISAQLHALGLILFVVGGVFLISAARAHGEANVLACWSFVLTGACVFATSATYHFLHDGWLVNKPLEFLLETLDHCFIYSFIAGTYTPILWNGLTDPWRVPLLFVVWGVALSGMAYTVLKPRLPRWMQHKALYTGLFVAMGWILIVRIGEVVERLSAAQLWLLAGGALAYTLGAVTYATQQPVLFKKYFGYHELWHLMVLIGASCHYFVIRLFF